jgi:hypothetical protein
VSWLDKLKAGDEVILACGGNRALLRVEHATATQVTVNGGVYRRSDGCRRGDKTHPRWCLLEATGALRRLVAEEDERRRLVSTIRRRCEDWDALALMPLAQLRRVMAALDGAEEVQG